MTSTNSQPRLYAEDEHGSTVILQLRKNRNYGRRFVTMFAETMNQISTLDRPAGYHRILWHLLSVLDATQWRKVSAPEMCRATGMAIATVQRALLQLQADRVILADGNTAARALKLNNRLAWQSSAEKWNAAEADPEIVDGRGR